MRRYRHRFSKDIDIFVPDPQFLGYLSPRLNDTVDAMVTNHVEQANFLKLYFPEGEIDFVAAGGLTSPAARFENVLHRPVQVETSIEILAKKVFHRAREFTARDLFDFAVIADQERSELGAIAHILRERREAILKRIATDDARLRTVFSQLAVIDHRLAYDDCVKVVQAALRDAG